MQVWAIASEPQHVLEDFRQALDIEMPKMDGLSFLSKIMTLRPMPVVMVSSLTQEGAEATLKALEIGAVDFVAKPASDLQSGLAAKQDEIVAKVKAAATARVRRSADIGPATPLKRMSGYDYTSTEKIIAVGYGSMRPLASNSTESGRAMNRRIDIIITPEAMNPE